MMRILISAYKNDLESNVCPNFGRCPLYLIMNSENPNSMTAYKNPAENASGGAGVSAAQFVANQGCEVVITGNVGPNAFLALQKAKINVYSARDLKISEAIEAFKNGSLEQIINHGSDGFGKKG